MKKQIKKAPLDQKEPRSVRVKKPVVIPDPKKTEGDNAAVLDKIKDGAETVKEAIGIWQKIKNFFGW